MSLENDLDDKPYRDFSDLMPILLAFILTVCGIAMFFFHFSAGAPQKPVAQPQPSEVTIGIGQGSNLQAPPAANPPAHP
jgi:hypothetical protein